MTRYYLSTPKMSVVIAVDDWRIITGAAPVIGEFIGQKLDNLLNWLKKQGQVEMIEI